MSSSLHRGELMFIRRKGRGQYGSMDPLERAKIVLEGGCEHLGDDAPSWYTLARERRATPDRAKVMSSLEKMRALHAEAVRGAARGEPRHPDIFARHIAELEHKLRVCDDLDADCVKA